MKWASLLLVLSMGCADLFRIREVEPTEDSSSAACLYETVAAEEPGQDEDQDSILNSMDTCPTVPFESAHDEDGDALDDACDPCPTLEISGDDAECDLVGAACDPDDTVGHVSTFVGFDSALGLTVEQLVMENDMLHGPVAVTFGRVLVNAPVSAIGRYETAGRADTAGTDYRSVSIDFIDQATGVRDECQLELSSTYARLAIQRDNAHIDSLALGVPTSSVVAYRLRADHDGSQLTCTIAGAYAGMLSQPSALGTVKYGVGINHQAATSVVETDYLSRIAPL